MAKELDLKASVNFTWRCWSNLPPASILVALSSPQVSYTQLETIHPILNNGPIPSFCGIDPTLTCVDTLAALPTSALDQLSCTNTPPTRGAETMVKCQLTRVQSRIKMLDEAIENLQQARSVLEQEEAKLASIMSPMCCIPTEILMTIFTLHAEDWWDRLCEWQLRGALLEDDYMGWDDFEGTEDWDEWMNEEALGNKLDRDLTDLTLRPTNVLSQVCHSWRAAARACSNLWSNVFLHESYGPPMAQALLRDQLRLSANRPLHISISYRFGHDHSLPLLLQDIFPTSHRWASISITIGAFDHPVFPRSPLSSPFPSLVSLSLILKCPYGYDQFTDDTFVYGITAADAPLRREVSLSWPDSSAATVDLPWAQLLKLRFWEQDGSHALEIVARLQEIIELDLLGLNDYDDSLDLLSFRSLPLPSLRCLRLSNIGCRESETPGMILPYLQVPSLQSLYWTGMRHNEMKELYEMCAPQGPSGTQDQGQKVLQNLHLYNPTRDVLEAGGYSRGESWGGLLEVIGPQLESVKIEYPASSGANATQFAQLLTDHVRASKLPRFHACTLQGVHISSTFLTHLIDLVDLHKCDIRVLNCTFDAQEELDDAFMMGVRRCFPKVISGGAFFELDIETPNRMRLFYTSETGPWLEESCGCRLKGMSL